MRFFQVHYFYEQYLSEFTRNNPGLSHRSYNEQLEVLLQDGFAASHLFTNPLQQYGYETALSICNYLPAQTRWVQENLPGFKYLPDLPYHTVLCQVAQFAPDILYLPALKMFDSAFVRTLPKRPALVVGWYGVEIDPDTDLTEFDLILSNSAIILQQAKNAGARDTAWFSPGMPGWLAAATERQPKKYDLSFCGSWSPQHTKRNAMLELLAGAAPKLGHPVMSFFLLPAQPVTSAVLSYAAAPLWGKAMYEAIKASRIVFNAEIDGFQSEGGNMRLFEATASGSFVLTEHHDNIKDYFVPGTEIETFSDGAELLDKVRYYLSHPVEREAIARRGQARCLQDYSLEKRAGELDRLFKQLLHRNTVPAADRFQHILRLKQEGLQPFAPNAPPKEANDRTPQLLNQAESLIISENFQEAAEILNRLKALRKPLQGVDYLRGICFLQGNQLILACEALREELRYFPENRQAAELLTQIEPPPLAGAEAYMHHAEFYELLAQIRPYTMLSNERLFSLYSLSRTICEQNLPGNFVECGVAAGGSSALLAAVIQRHSKLPRMLYSCDSFSGMPDPTELDTAFDKKAQDTGWGAGTCSAPEASLRGLVKQLGVSEHVVPVKGFFHETLPELRIAAGEIALLHLDGDWYESTRTILHNLYDSVVEEGALQIDDYGLWDGCRKAVNEFQEERSITFALNTIDGTGVWFNKPPALQESLEKVVSPDTLGILRQSGALERMKKPSGQIRPLLLFCETVNICNSACLFCPYSRQTRTQGIMPDQLFREVLHQYNDMGGGYLSLTPMVGDFLLDKHLPQRLTDLQDFAQTIVSSVTTNLCSMCNWDDETVLDLLQTLSMLHISCYGISQEEHSQITGRDHFDEFRLQVKRLLRLKRQLQNSSKLSIGFRNLYDHDSAQVKAFQTAAFGEEIPVSGIGFSYCNWGNSIGGALPGDAYFFPAPENQVPCLFLPMALMVFHDGKVSACACCDYDGQAALHLGDLTDGASLKELFNGPRNRAVWQQHQNGQLPQYCRQCSFHLPLSTLHKNHPLLQNPYDFIGG